MANYRKLGRVTSHRNLMLRNLVTDLLRCGRIETTERYYVLSKSEDKKQVIKLFEISRNFNNFNI